MTEAQAVNAEPRQNGPTVHERVIPTGSTQRPARHLQEPLAVMLLRSWPMARGSSWQALDAQQNSQMRWAHIGFQR